MAKYITISTIGMKSRSVDASAGIAQSTAEMSAYVLEQVNQVVKERPDLIVLPEYCDIPANFTGSLRREYATFKGNLLLDALSSIAKTGQCYIVYPTLHLKEDGVMVNSIRIIDRHGQIAGMYCKNFPTIVEMEQFAISPGREALVIELDFGRVGFIICFDLNFPELLERYKRAKPDVMIFSSVYHGGLMQAYWAYACRTHFISAVANLSSCILSPVGHLIASNTNYFNYVTEKINLDCAVVHLDGNWEKLAAIKEKYGIQVRVFDPGLLGSVLISSETAHRNIHQIIEEFAIEMLDDYIDRSRKHILSAASEEFTPDTHE